MMQVYYMAAIATNGEGLIFCSLRLVRLLSITLSLAVGHSKPDPWQPLWHFNALQQNKLNTATEKKL